MQSGMKGLKLGKKLILSKLDYSSVCVLMNFLLIGKKCFQNFLLVKM